MNATVLLDGRLRNRDQLPHVLRRRVAEIDHDVGVDVRDLGVPVAKAL